jgi:hypothetical protein
MLKCGNKKIYIALFLIFICLFAYIKFERSPIKSDWGSGYFFISTTANCYSCISPEDALFLEDQSKKIHKDTVQLDISYYGIDGVLGVVKYEGGQYIDFLNGFNSKSYYFNVGNIYFGPFGETMATY